MASVTVTETGVTLVVQLQRNPSGDSISVTAHSLTDVPEVNGRSLHDFDIAPTLTPAQMATITAMLDFIEGRVKEYWDIP